MRAALVTIIANAIFLAILYGFGAICSWSVNPSEWSGWLRVPLAMIILASVIHQLPDGVKK